MCGIVGYAGEKGAQPRLLRALRKLEYRGYDSSGIAILGGSINVHKEKGRVEELEKFAPQFPGSIGIGHTRWATHGEPSAVNAHPHTDCSGRFAVVHNGVITNYRALKEELIREGHQFLSETDTEVIPHLIEKYFKGILETAVAESLSRLQGSYAIAVIARDDPKMVVAKNGCPLVIGLGVRENMIASDIPPLMDFTNRVIYLEDGEVGVITGDSVKINRQGQEVAKIASIVDWHIEDVQKRGYDHFMLKEIHEQPGIIQKAFGDYSPYSTPVVGLDFMANKGGRGLLILACGTSFHAGLIGKYLIEELLGTPVRVELASEVNHREKVISVTNAIAITQSGETADVLISLKKLKEAGCSTLAMTNVVGSSVARLADRTLYTRAGPEMSVAATKSFMAQLIELYKLVLSQPTDQEKVKQELIAQLKSIPDLVQQVLDNEKQITDCAKFISQCTDVFYIGRGINYPVALEGALKLKEISYIHAEGFAAGELKHGTFSLLQRETPVVAIVNRDFTYDAMITNIKEIKARKAPVITLVADDDYRTDGLADMTIRVPKIHSLFSPVVNTVALQLLAYYAAKYRDCPIDFPRNLAKSVTVE
jgi:glutamine---fructose-6-phosphate transaminase (isomerizing)